MGTNTTDDTWEVWEREMKADQERERALKDAANAESMKEQQKEEEATAQKDFEEEIRQVDAMLHGGFADPEECARLRAVAQKKLEEKLEWIRTFGPGLLKVLEKKK